MVLTSPHSLENQLEKKKFPSEKRRAEMPPTQVGAGSPTVVCADSYLRRVDELLPPLLHKLVLIDFFYCALASTRVPE